MCDSAKIQGFKMTSSTLAYLAVMIVCGFCSAVDPSEKPRINLDQIRHVVWGRNLTLDCEITVDANASVTMSWKVPDSVPEERWSFSQPQSCTENVTNDSCTWKTVLTVSDVEKTDEGDYICVAGNISESQASISRIWDPNHTYYMNATVNGSTDQISDARESVVWKIVVDTYPENFTLEWFKPDGKVIVPNVQDKQSKYSHTKEGMAHFFKISQLKLEDTGNYTIVISTEKNKTTVNLKLTVRAKPSVRLDKLPILYQRGKSVNFSCESSGLPLPNVTWIIVTYPDFSSKDNPERSYPSNFINEPGTKGPYHLVSTLNVKITRTVDLTCESCNDIDCVNSTKQILVSDGTSENFGIIGPNRSEVIVGDDVRVTCEADGYIYSNSVSWSREEPQERSVDSSEINATQSKSNTSWLSILDIRNVQKSDGGSYVCQVTTRRGHSIKKGKHQLIVHDASAPRLRPSSISNAMFVVDLESQADQSITLNCSAEGMPIPRITWYKDNEPISSNNQYKLSNNNSTLEITHFLSGDGGRYSCEAKNRYGTATSYTDIEIAGDSQSNTIWIIIVCVLVVILVVVIIFYVVRLSRAKKSRKKLIERGSAHFKNGVVGFPYLDSIDRSEPADYFMINNGEPERGVELQIREAAEQSTEL